MPCALSLECLCQERWVCGCVCGGGGGGGGCDDVGIWGQSYIGLCMYLWWQMSHGTNRCLL